MRRYWLICLGLVLAILVWLVPAVSRNGRIASSLVGGVLIVFGLAPGRVQHDDPAHRLYKK